MRHLALAFVLLIALTAAGAARSGSESGLIAFTRYRFQNAPLWSEIWVARPDGSHAVKISHAVHAVEDDQAHFSPDGHWIVFDRCGRGACSIWLVHPDGTGQYELHVPCPTGRCDDANPSFAPDGRHVVFERDWGVVKHGTSPDNDQTQHAAIAEATLDGAHVTYLRRFDHWEGGFYEARISPDGRRLVFGSYRWTPARGGAGTLYVVPLAGGTPRRLTKLELDAGGSAWSPDGTRILFKSSAPGGELAPGSVLYEVRADGTGLRRLTNVGGYHYVLTGSYSPDGHSVVFATDDGATGAFADVFTLDLATGRRIQVTRTRNLDGWPAWGVDAR
jgi:Tol biopolymer transport system component